MSLNGLTGSAGLKLGPVVLETLVKHYFERFKASQKIPTATSEGAAHDGTPEGTAPSDNLRKEELLYDQAFSIVKEFLSTASRHTVEELQQFSNTRTPSPPWVKVLRVVIPMSCCDEAAEYLIDALGGESATKRIVGGTKWWQIRGINGVDGEWIVAKKDWREAKRRAKSKGYGDRSDERTEREREKSTLQSASTDSTSTGDTISEPGYTPDMDEQRCILYLHGGGYYFGSVDQERYSIQRFARKMNGRVFAISYRLSPQYPFPCAIQDAIAAYLYLIRPPPEAEHKPVKPQHIVIMGDSAGGGLSLATLQVIRDSGLPQCAGGVLISPWCDLSHSFPSIHSNTETDVIPYSGLSVHKPSLLWPPPGEDDSHTVRQGIRHGLRKVAGLGEHSRFKSFLGSRGHGPPPKDEPVTVTPTQVADSDRQMDLGASVSIPTVADGPNRSVVLQAKDGETLTVDSQIHFYVSNDLLSHPLICHCRAYLGGLPPLFFIAGDKEVLRDEIIYTAHRAANPSNFPIPDESKRLYPRIVEFAARYPTPTKVHLQVYDGCAHVLPILFAFTTPAKYCFRAIAGFCRFVTGMQASTPGPPSPTAANGPGTPSYRSFFGGSFFTSPPEEVVGELYVENKRRKSWWGGGERESSPSSRTSRKSEREKQRSDKDEPGDGHTKEQPMEWSHEATCGAEKAEVRVGARGEGVGNGSTDHPGSESVVKDVTTTEVVSEAEVVGSGSPSVRGDGPGEAGVVPDKQLKVQTTAKTGTRDDGTRSLRQAKSIRSLSSGKSNKEKRGSTLKKRWSLMVGNKSAPEIPIPVPRKNLTEDVAGSRFERVKEPQGVRCAGDYPPIYQGGFAETNFIRERVSIRGVIRPLEPESKLPALQLREDLVGTICELSLRRYIQGKTECDSRFSGALKSIDKKRKRNLKLAHKEGETSMGHLESYVRRVKERSDSGLDVLDSPRLQKVSAGSWSWSWALDEDEHPPPSSIVSRRDTWEARQLAMIADIMPENTMSGNNLWQHLVTFLTVTPDKRIRMPTEREHPRPEAVEQAGSNRTNLSTPLGSDTKIQATAKATQLAQTDGTPDIPEPLTLGSAHVQSRGWSFWTRGSLWKERFRVSHFSKSHKRTLSSTSTTTPASRTPSSTRV